MKKAALALLIGTAVVSNALFVSASYAEGPGDNRGPQQQQQWKPGGQGQGQGPGGGQQPGRQGGGQPGHQGGEQGRPDARNDRNPGQGRQEQRPGPQQQREHFAFSGHDFRRGHPVPRDFRWDRYRVDDWRGRGLYAPPSGYRWAYIDGNYVLIAVATGIITSIIINSALH
ncbi:RcnB family protein [Musicola keenii]|uniref:RcnB family protein n=1 Tax=Musicola keenii TaxID=2884250 RepID=UPI0017876143|nr:RcnB family protein [Musicola keenii]